MLEWATWQVAALGVVLIAAAVLLVIWWRQQSYRWALVLVLCLLLAPAMSFWSSVAFEVAEPIATLFREARERHIGVVPAVRGSEPTTSGL